MKLHEEDGKGTTTKRTTATDKGNCCLKLSFCSVKEGVEELNKWNFCDQAIFGWQ